MANKPISPQTGYSLDDMLGRFDILIDQLAIDQASAGQPAPVEPLEPVAETPVETPAEPLEVPVTMHQIPDARKIVLSVAGLFKSFGNTTAVDGIDLSVRAGTIFGIVGPNGAGKTTTLSMITGLLRPDEGLIRVADLDVWSNSGAAKLHMGILPDRLMLFDRLTGRQLLYYAAVLRGLDSATAKKRSADLIATFGISEAQDRLVSDYSAGMSKKVALAAAMIHAPRLLILDEPFESVDSVSADTIVQILQSYVASGGTVVLSSHSMDLIERVCDHVAVFVDGRILSSGTVAEVRGDQSLEERFVDLISANNAGEDLEWLRSFSD